jgi:NADH:ubiquinone oxidoreductase subunit 3 (subunit A)
MNFDLAVYYPIFIFLAVIVLTAIGILAAAHLIGPRRQTAVKQMPYESGMDPVGDARQHFDVKFYLIAILFLVFDVELLFLYPWAVAAYREGNETLIPAELRPAVVVTILVFLVTLAIGYIYAWRKGVFQWR